jgi:hypothetical protein
MVDALGFPVEEIPDADSVFMRAHKDYIRDGDLVPGVFREQDGGMSVDWNKYASKEDTKQRAKNPANNAVVSLSVGGIRKIDDLDVRHTPELSNRAHSEVYLPDSREELTEVRLLLHRLAEIVIPPG